MLFQIRRVKQRQRWYECSPCSNTGLQPSNHGVTWPSHDDTAPDHYVTAPSHYVTTPSHYVTRRDVINSHRKPPDSDSLKRIAPSVNITDVGDYFPPALDAYEDSAGGDAAADEDYLTGARGEGVVGEGGTPYGGEERRIDAGTFHTFQATKRNMNVDTKLQTQGSVY